MVMIMRLNFTCRRTLPVLLIIKIFSANDKEHITINIIIIISSSSGISIQPLGRFGQRPGLSQATGMALVGVLRIFSPLKI